MGRRTWESLPPRFRPLPGRRNLVLSRTPQEGAETFPDLPQALAAVSGDVWVIGGAAVYRAAQPFADRIVVTEIQESFDGDTYAPDVGAPAGLRRGVAGVVDRVALPAPDLGLTSPADGRRHAWIR